MDQFSLQQMNKKKSWRLKTSFLQMCVGAASKIASFDGPQFYAKLYNGKSLA